MILFEDSEGPDLTDAKTNLGLRCPYLDVIP